MNSISKLSIIAAAITASLFITACDSKKTEEEHLSSAKSYIQNSQYDAAIIELKGALRINAKSSEVRYLLGKAYLDLGNGVAAEKEFERSISYGSAKAVSGMIQALYRQREFEQVISFIDELESQDKNNEQVALTYKAMSLYRLNSYLDAEQTLASAINNQPENQYLDLARAFQKVVEREELEALSIIEATLNKYPKFYDALLLKAQIELSLQKLGDASSSFEQYSKLQPADKIAKLFLVNALIKNSEHEKAEPIVDELLKQVPNHPYTNQLKGLVRYSQSDFEQAKLHIEKAIQNGLDSPENKLIAGFSAYNLKNYEQSHSYLTGLSESLAPTHPAMRLLAITQMKLGYPVEASKALLKLESLSENDMQLYTAASIELLGLNNEKQIGEMKEKVQALQPDDAKGFLNKAKLQLSLDDIEGVVNLERSLELNANSTEAKSLLASEYIKAGEYDKAIKIANDWINDSGENVEALNIIAMANLGANREDKAISAMERALTIENTNPLSLLYLSEKHIKSGDYANAKVKLELLLTDKPDYIPGLSSYFYLMNVMNDSGPALQAIKSSQENNSTSIPHTMLLAKAYTLLGQDQEVINLLEKLPRSGRLPSLYWVTLGNSLLVKGELEKLDTLYEEWTTLQPMQKLSWIRVAVTAEQQKNYNKGLLATAQGLQNIPEDIELKILQTHFYLKTNKAAMAQRNINDLSDEVKSRPGVESLQGRIFAQQGKYQKALDKLTIGYQAAPNSKNAVLIANVYKALGKTEKSEDFLVQHVKRFPKQVFSKNILADNYAMAGKVKEAIKHYEGIIEIEPNNIIVLNNLAWYELQEGNITNADRYGELAFKAAPLNASVLDTLAAVKLAKGEKAKAIELLQKAVDLAPNNANIQKHLAEAKVL